MHGIPFPPHKTSHFHVSMLFAAFQATTSHLDATSSIWEPLAAYILTCYVYTTYIYNVYTMRTYFFST